MSTRGITKGIKLSQGVKQVLLIICQKPPFRRPQESVIKQPKFGKKLIFSTSQGKEQEEHILKCSQLFYRLTDEMIREVALKFVDRNKKSTFYYVFIKRHPNIGLNKLEPDT